MRSSTPRMPGRDCEGLGYEQLQTSRFSLEYALDNLSTLDSRVSARVFAGPDPLLGRHQSAVIAGGRLWLATDRVMEARQTVFLRSCCAKLKQVPPFEHPF